MMEISNETKAKVFAQYLGQDYGYMDGTVVQPPVLRKFPISKISLHVDGVILDSKCKLVLKPLDKITDEDAIEVAKLFNPKVSNEELEESLKYKDSLCEAFTDISKNHCSEDIPLISIFLSAQYLQSKGYDLPNYLLNGKTLHESGLAIYE